ncbi:SAM-dependent methyltransferase [Aliidiomarina iranensis]|uniref:SAM-dependent methyltransferase n=1 Tax=Aliidiomarina iranensis TaxID=1434071 RepID=A0A432VWF1_9GAMM|nr:class I SAM-dependent methyltransferase [Aliidiomarina iranensis]RUO20888.1 SAM-dependent methyltransferase [Aliidiomarina iranensis]
MSIDYYNKNAAEFHADTACVDMAALYEEFLPRLSVGAHIIDAGCGSGRDALAFLQAGFRVTAFDASPSLVAIAQERLGTEKVKLATFNEFSVSEPADAIWACASLLHVPLLELKHTFVHLSEQLKNRGLFYCSFKYGDNETERNGRRFTNLNEALLQQVIQQSDLAIQKTWITGDARPGREDEKWLNAILVKAHGKG